jgi:hypothetical protein
MVFGGVRWAAKLTVIAQLELSLLSKRKVYQWQVLNVNENSAMIHSPTDILA